LSLGLKEMSGIGKSTEQMNVVLLGKRKRLWTGTRRVIISEQEGRRRCIVVGGKIVNKMLKVVLEDRLLHRTTVSDGEVSAFWCFARPLRFDLLSHCDGEWQ
jgi:hypothetical protein